jgi:hypothetical protein
MTAGLRGQVAERDVCLSARAAYLFRDGVATFRVAAMNHDHDSFVSKRSGDASTNAGTAASYESDFSL